MSVNWKVTRRDDLTVAEFDLEGGLADPGLLPGIKLPEGLDTRRGLVLSGRGPIWLYAHLAHLAHGFAWVATHDPRLGYVVVQNHVPCGPAVGEVIEP